MFDLEDLRVVEYDSDGEYYRYDISRLRGVSLADRDDKVSMLPVMQINGMALRYVSTALRDDRDVVSEALWRNGQALKYASPRFRADEGLVRLAVRRSCAALIYANIPYKDLPADLQKHLVDIICCNHTLLTENDAFMNDKDFALVVVLKDGSFLEYFSSALRADEKVVFVALLRDNTALKYASDELRLAMN